MLARCPCGWGNLCLDNLLREMETELVVPRCPFLSAGSACGRGLSCAVCGSPWELPLSPGPRVTPQDVPLLKARQPGRRIEWEAT